MGLSRKKATYLGLLGLGVAALVADRLFFTPSGAEASPGAPVALEPKLPVTTPRAEATEPTPAGKPLSSRLAQASAGPWDDADVPDAFHPRASWIAEAMMGPPVPDAPERKSENVPREHKLSMIFRDEQRRPVGALIDRKQVKIGDTLDDGLVITSIDNDSVELHGSAGVVNLPLRSHP